MNVHDPLIEDHALIRQLAADLRNGDQNDLDTLTQRLARFQKAVMRHFEREDAYYRVVDGGKRFSDRELIHDLRNDHAAVVFSLESLAIRLRKSGATPEWIGRLETMLGVLLPHLDREEKALFPAGSAKLTPEETKTILNQIKDHAL